MDMTESINRPFSMYFRNQMNLKPERKRERERERERKHRGAKQRANVLRLGRGY